MGRVVGEAPEYLFLEIFVKKEFLTVPRAREDFGCLVGFIVDVYFINTPL